MSSTVAHLPRTILGRVSLGTKNVYAQVDLEMKSKALRCVKSIPTLTMVGTGREIKTYWHSCARFEV